MTVLGATYGQNGLALAVADELEVLGILGRSWIFGPLLAPSQIHACLSVVFPVSVGAGPSQGYLHSPNHGPLIILQFDQFPNLLAGLLFVITKLHRPPVFIGDFACFGVVLSEAAR